MTGKSTNDSSFKDQKTLTFKGSNLQNRVNIFYKFAIYMSQVSHVLGVCLSSSRVGVTVVTWYMMHIAYVMNTVHKNTVQNIDF